MKTTLDFLRAILPESPFYAGAAIFPGENYAKQRSFDNIESLAAYVEQHNNSGHDTYFGVGGFKQNWHDHPQGKRKPNGDIKKVFRTMENSHGFRSLFLDLDCGEGKTYATQADAIRALKATLTATGMPLPTLVSSGYGIHCYWRLDKDITPASFDMMSGVLHAMVVHTGLDADASVTMDRARILRPINTMNYKRSVGMPVTLLHDGQVNSLNGITGILAAYVRQHRIRPATPKKAAEKVPSAMAELRRMVGNDEQFGAVMGHVMEVPRDKNADMIISQCAQVREGGVGTYSSWFHMLSVMNCCPNGREKAHTLSSPYPGFNETEFNDKYNEVEYNSNGPASCKSFDRERPGMCKNCPHFGRIVGPAELGRGHIIPAVNVQEETAKAAEPQVIEQPVTEKKKMVVERISGWKFAAPGLRQVDGKGIFVEYQDEDGNMHVESTPIIESCIHLMYSVRVESSSVNQEVTYVFNISHRDEAPRQVRLGAKDISEPKMKEWLFNAQILPVRNVKSMAVGMLTYLATLQRRVPQVDMRSEFGWNLAKSTDGGQTRTFVIGERLLTPKSVATDVALPDALSAYSMDKMDVKGTLDAWKAVPAFYKEHNIIWGQLGLCLGFAAPLMPQAPGIAKNGIVNFWSTSGSGKTSLQHAINSIWGHPERQLMNVSSTGNSRFRTMGFRNNLPVCINEITNLSDVDLSETLFQISEGREKERLGDGGKSFLSSGKWNTITIMSSNNTVFDKMQKMSSARDGEIKRVLEINVKKSGIKPELANRMLSSMQDNYGQAGQAFVQALLDNPVLFDQISKAMDNWVNRHIDSQDERYWLNTGAAALVAGRIAKQLGLIDIDIDAVEKLILDSIEVMRGSMATASEHVADLLPAFLRENHHQTLVVTHASPPPSEAQKTSYIVSMPRDGAAVRIEKDSNTCYIEAVRLREFAARYDITPDQLLVTLIDQGRVELERGKVRKPKQVQVTMTKGCPNSTGTRVRCYKIHLDDEKVSGANDDKENG